MKITREDVLKVAQKAHLSLTDAEVTEFTKDLEQMVWLAGQLNEFDMTNLKKAVQEPELYNVFRKDETKPSMDKADLLSNAPQEKEGCFFVPQIVE